MIYSTDITSLSYHYLAFDFESQDHGCNPRIDCLCHLSGILRICDRRGHTIFEAKLKKSRFTGD
ncbi:unnamed protein product [Brassica oleracea var. botrytis]|uniref:(rape) hypothetical protein n=1 Tax=Brassica napus TaxID=3708 RepID=A0A816ILM1_BRANA|nr:unnamed protein product [Brassica napus]